MQPDSLMLAETALAQWHRLVVDAEAASHHQLPEEVEAYLVHTLALWTSRDDIGSGALAIEVLQQLANRGGRADGLRAAGDRCLLHAGLFPDRSERLMIRVSYFIRLGITAYDAVAGRLGGSRGRLFQRLADGFLALTEVLGAMRQDTRNWMSPLAAAELWLDTGSPAARAVLGRRCSGYIVADGPGRRH